MPQPFSTDFSPWLTSLVGVRYELDAWTFLYWLFSMAGFSSRSQIWIRCPNLSPWLWVWFHSIVVCHLLSTCPNYHYQTYFQQAIPRPIPVLAWLDITHWILGTMEYRKIWLRGLTMLLFRVITASILFRHQWIILLDGLVGREILLDMECLLSSCFAIYMYM
jgi:hypothetical protein